jgi:hypothetical protein
MQQIPIDPAWGRRKMLAEVAWADEYLRFCKVHRLSSRSYSVMRAKNYRKRLLAAIAEKAARSEGPAP